MRNERYPWEDSYQFVGSNITADGVRINYPFDPAFPADVRFITGPAPGRNLVRLNRHEFLEVIYLYSGNMEIQIQDRRFPLNKGDVVVIGPHIYHQCLFKPNVETKLLSLNFRPEAVRTGTAEGEDEVYLSSFLCQGRQFPHVISGVVALSERVLDLLLNLHTELPARTVLSRLAAKTYLRELSLLLARQFEGYLEAQAVLDRRQKDVDRLQPLFQLLDKRYGQRIKVRDAAHICGMSSSYFMRFFKLTTGQSFRAYLTGFRIAKAQAMLSAGKASIVEVSQKVGFCSQSYFGEVFRDMLGMTPRAFRQRFGIKIPPSLHNGTGNPSALNLSAIAAQIQICASALGPSTRREKDSLKQQSLR